MAIGLRGRVIEVAGFGLFGGIGLGLFRHTDNIIRETNTVIPIQAGLHASLSRAWRVVGTWRRMWISDEESEGLLGDAPRYSVLTLGVERRLIF